MSTKADLYFVEGGMDICLSILHITNPCMAPSYVRSLLDFLMSRTVLDADILVMAPLQWKVSLIGMSQLRFRGLCLVDRHDSCFLEG